MKTFKEKELRISTPTSTKDCCFDCCLWPWMTYIWKRAKKNILSKILHAPLSSRQHARSRVSTSVFPCSYYVYHYSKLLFFLSCIELSTCTCNHGFLLHWNKYLKTEVGFNFGSRLPFVTSYLLQCITSNLANYRFDEGKVKSITYQNSKRVKD